MTSSSPFPSSSLSSLSSSSSSELSLSSVVFPLVALSASIGLATLAAIQTDSISRKFFLSPSQLHSKRQNEYSYQWKNAMDRLHMQLDSSIAGGLTVLEADPEIVAKMIEYSSKTDDLEALVQKIIHKEPSTTLEGKTTASIFHCLKIDKDPMDKSGEFYLFLIEQTVIIPTNKKGDIGDGPEVQDKSYHQVPLMKFAMLLAKAFENQTTTTTTTTTFCFVADASSGKASSLIEELVQESKTGIAVISEPLWLTQIARLMEAKIYDNSEMEKLVYAVCRLEAFACRFRPGQQTSKTVMISLPGQVTTSTLLPIIKSVFPNDRHVFAYDDCVASVRRGIDLMRQFRRSDMHDDSWKKIVYGMGQNPIRYTVPLPSMTPLTEKISTLQDALSKLSIRQASITQAWMSSVDAFVQAKDDKATDGYSPYVCKLSCLTEPDDPTFSRVVVVDDNKSDAENMSNAVWSLSSLLQYVTTGRQSKIPVPEGVMDAACCFMEEYNNTNNTTRINKNGTSSSTTVITVAESKAIENCIVQHEKMNSRFLERYVNNTEMK